MKLLYSVLLAFLSYFFSFSKLQAQCPTIEFIFVNSCSVIEQDGEFMILNSGDTGLNISSTTVDYPYPPEGVNGDLGLSGECHFMSPPLIGVLNSCPNIIQVGEDSIIPPHQIVVVLTSFAATGMEYDWTPLCGDGKPIYLVQSTCDRTAGAFKNYGEGAGTRTIRLFTQNCVDSLIYYPEQLYSGTEGGINGGDFVMPCDTSLICPEGVLYGNDGCVAPSIANFISQMNEFDKKQALLSIFPNPANNEIRIDWKENIEFSIVISGLNGSQIIQKRGIGTTTTVTINNLSPGIYFVRSFFENGQIGMAKFVKI